MVIRSVGNVELLLRGVAMSDDRNQRNVTISITVTDAERQLFEAAAANEDRTLSSWARLRLKAALISERVRQEIAR